MIDVRKKVYRPVQTTSMERVVQFNSLLCLEKNSGLSDDLSSRYNDTFEETTHAVVDLKSTEDNRILADLLASSHSIQTEVLEAWNYGKDHPDTDGNSETRQGIQPSMRKIVTEWMLEICTVEHCEEDVFYLSCSYLDRLLMLKKMDIDSSNLQLLAAVCLFIASKFASTAPLSSVDLAEYTANSVTCQEIQDWELMVLLALEWNLASVSPYALLNQIISRIPLETKFRGKVRSHAKTFIDLCITDADFTVFSQSTIAGASILSASTGLLSEVWCRNSQLLQHICIIIQVEPECLQTCHQQLEDLLRASLPEQKIISYSS